MTKLTCKNAPFDWDEKCQNALKLAQKQLESAPILIYPDKSKPFHLFTDASKYTWSSVLMQTVDDTPEIGNQRSVVKEREGSMVESSQNTTDDTQWKHRPPTHFLMAIP